MLPSPLLAVSRYGRLEPQVLWQQLLPPPPVLLSLLVPRLHETVFTVLLQRGVSQLFPPVNT